MNAAVEAEAARGNGLTMAQLVLDKGWRMAMTDRVALSLLEAAKGPVGRNPQSVMCPSPNGKAS